MKISRIVLYGDTTGYALSVPHIASFLRHTFDMAVQWRPLSSDIRAEMCMPASMFRPHKPGLVHGLGSRVELYDGYCLVEQLCHVLEGIPGHFHMVLADAILGTYDHSDMKYHGRALVAANPCIISLPGMIMAPARPRDYCIDIMSIRRTGGDISKIESKHAGRFLTAHDKRMQAVAEGYAMQAVFYYETGEAFCTQRDCRLYNAHWQEDLIHSQTVSASLCSHHSALLKTIKCT